MPRAGHAPPESAHKGKINSLLARPPPARERESEKEARQGRREKRKRPSPSTSPSSRATKEAARPCRRSRRRGPDASFRAARTDQRSDDDVLGKASPKPWLRHRRCRRNRELQLPLQGESERRWRELDSLRKGEEIATVRATERERGRRRRRFAPHLSRPTTTPPGRLSFVRAFPFADLARALSLRRRFP